MTTLKACWLLLAVLAVGTLVGCSSASTKSAGVSDRIRTSLGQTGFKDVSVSQDRDKGVVTLGGRVGTDGDKAQAASIAKTIAGAQVVANQIAVIPPGAESVAKKANPDLAKGNESNLDAALMKAKPTESVTSSVQYHVVTLTGEVDSRSRRAWAEEVTAVVPNVQQVMNERQGRNQKAGSSK